LKPPKHRKRRPAAAAEPARTPIASLQISDALIDTLEEAGCVYVDDIPNADCETLKQKIDRARFFHLKSMAKQQGVAFHCCAVG
jgi:hypothetical protein